MKAGAAAAVEAGEAAAAQVMGAGGVVAGAALAVEFAGVPAFIIGMAQGVREQLDQHATDAAVKAAARRLDSLRDTLERVGECLEEGRKRGVLGEAQRVVQAVSRRLELRALDRVEDE